MRLDKQFDRDIIIYAFRYTLGRHSYAPGLMMDKLEEIWDQMSNGDKELIFREIQEHHEFLDRIDKNATIKRPGMEQMDLDHWLNWREKMMKK